jgi:hypothetical protein
MKFPRGKFSFIAHGCIFNTRQVTGVACDSVSMCLGLDQVAEVFETKDSSNCLLVKYRKTLLLVSGPSLADPLDYSLRFLAEEEEFALIFSWGCFVRMLVHASPPAVIATVNFDKKMTFIVLVPDVKRAI